MKILNFSKENNLYPFLSKHYFNASDTDDSPDTEEQHPDILKEISMLPGNKPLKVIPEKEMDSKTTAHAEKEELARQQLLLIWKQQKEDDEKKIHKKKLATKKYYEEEHSEEINYENEEIDIDY